MTIKDLTIADIYSLENEKLACGICGCVYRPAIEYNKDDDVIIKYHRCPKCGENDWRKEFPYNDYMPTILISS